MPGIEKKHASNISMPVHVYSSDQRSGVFSTMKAVCRDFPVAHSLGFRFAERNIRARYRQSILGVLWALLPPLATAAIWIILNQSNIVTINHAGGNYPLFVITGTMLWSVFSTAVTTPVQTIQANTSILVKINFPREALMITAFYEILFSTGIALVIIAAEIIYFQVPITGHTFLFFPAMIVLIIMGMCFGLLILPVAVLYKDIQFALPTLLQFAMYLTPVVYATPVFSGAAKILALNPVSPVLTSAREWLLGLDANVNWGLIGILAVISIFVLVIGIVIQRIALELLIERMGT